MGGGKSGLYSKTFSVSELDFPTSAELRKFIRSAFDLDSDENTATVWGHLEATQPDYPGTHLPRSFVLDTPGGKFWTHAHGTKHMYSAVKKALESTSFAGANHGMLTQFLLYDFRKAVISATRSGVRLDGKGRMFGHWELGFSKKPQDEFPVVMHAKFLGFN